MTGKLADTVMAVRNGVQLARKYQPIVSNPNTPAQVAVRAKLKLMSQLSAVMAPVIAMPRVGAVSSRNLFVKENYGATSYNSDEASIELADIKLTKSVVSLPDIRAAWGTQTGDIDVNLGAGEINLSRVVYCAFLKQADNTLRLVRTLVVNDPGSSGGFADTMKVYPVGEYAIYAYGVRDNTDSARTTFSNLQVVTAETVAKIITSRTLTEADVTLTETRYVLLNAPA